MLNTKAEKQELRIFIDYIFFRLKESCSNILGSIDHALKQNKLVDLHLAKQFGLKIPFTQFYLDGKRDCLNKIVKVASSTLYWTKDGDNYTTGLTSRISDVDMDLYDSQFPSLIQKEVEKDVEIRVLFVDNIVYSMAIFSQNDRMTEVDFRNYNGEKPNRIEPYQLPRESIESLKELMKYKSLNFGSIDFIKSSKNGEYYFLEINPCGQYERLASIFNSQVEKKIAKYLRNE